MLNNTSGLKGRGHHSEIGTSIDQRSISEEFIRCGPEAVRVLVLEMTHLVGATSGIRIPGIGWSSDKELDLVVALFNDLLGYFKNQVNTLLCSDPTNEGEKGN